MIKIYITIILNVVLHGCETLSLNVQVEHRFTVFKKRVLRKLFKPKRDEVTEEWKQNGITRSFMICSHQILLV